MAGQPEFSRPVRIDTLGPGPRRLSIEADEAERSALAERFGLLEIGHLSAQIALSSNGRAVDASGTLRAKVTQRCVATAEPVPAAIEETFRIRFVPPVETQRAEEEIELSAEDCDTIFYEGAAIDVGEAVAETLSLSLDPWPRAPGADEALKRAGVKSEEQARAEQEPGPFAGLATLKDKLK